MINDDIDTIEIALRKVFRDMGVKDINVGDIYKAVPMFPAINVMLTSAEQNGLQSFQNTKIGWNLNYDISCLYAGSERGLTFKNSQKFVNKIYDALQRKKGDKLDNTVFDLECMEIQYGRTAINETSIDGGVIKLIIQIHEVR